MFDMPGMNETKFLIITIIMFGLANLIVMAILVGIIWTHIATNVEGIWSKVYDMKRTSEDQYAKLMEIKNSLSRIETTMSSSNNGNKTEIGI